MSKIETFAEVAVENPEITIATPADAATLDQSISHLVGMFDGAPSQVIPADSVDPTNVKRVLTMDPDLVFLVGHDF
jgi:hypothetical protein